MTTSLLPAQHEPPAFTRSTRIARAAEEMFGIDLRSLAAFRVAVGTLLLVNLAVRATDLGAHYTDAGILPRVSLFAAKGVVLSLHALSGSLWLQVLLFAVAVVAALSLLLGYRTRLATVVSWVLLVSLHVRNPYVNNSGDTILLLVLLWGIFLPLGARWSVDALRTVRIERASPYVLSAATLGILLQVGFIYIYSVFHKTHPVWTEEHSALYYALSLDVFATGLGSALLDAPDYVLQLLTRGTLLLEFWGPILAFAPVFRAPIRMAVAFAFIGFHGGLILTMELGLFPWICMAAWLLFLPAAFWDRVLARMDKGSRWSAPALRERIEATVRPRSGMRQTGFTGELGACTTVFLALLLVYTVYANQQSLARTVLYGSAGEVQQSVDGAVRKVGFVQNWRMFAPRPARYDGWYVMRGTLADGTVVNLFDEEKGVAWEKPGLVYPTYVNQRWRKYLVDHYQSEKFEAQRAPLGAYLRERWNRSHPDQPVQRVEVFMMQEETPPPGEAGPVEQVLLYSTDEPAFAQQ